MQLLIFPSCVTCCISKGKQKHAFVIYV
jgi:hypothetical protein